MWILLFSLMINAEPVSERARLNEEVSKLIDSRLSHPKNQQNAAAPNGVSPLDVGMAGHGRALKASNELFAARIEKNTVAALRKAMEKGTVKSLQRRLDPGLQFSSLGSLPIKHETIKDGFKMYYTSQFSKSAGADRFVRDMDAYLKRFDMIDYVDLKIIALEGATIADRDLEQQKELSLRVKMDMRGIIKGRRHADIAVFDMNLKTTRELPHISSLNWREFQSVTVDRKGAFTLAVNNAGFDSGKTYLRLEALRRGGYALAMEDFNNDGYLDAFVGNFGESSMWLGDKDGNVRPATAGSDDVTKVTLAKAASFVDLDNDGWKDLVVTRFRADTSSGDVLVFKNKNGAFEEVKNAFPSDILRDFAMPMAIADLNNDGLLDIYVGFPGERDFSAGLIKSDKSLAAHGLYINKGKFQFKDNTKNIDRAFTFVVRPHGALASDANMDGKMDLLIMDDQMNLSPIYYNQGNGKFVLKNEDTRVLNYGYGMGIASGDINQDGLTDYLMTNATFTSQKRLQFLSKAQLRKENSPSMLTEVNIGGVRLFLNTKSGRFFEFTDSSALQDAGEAAGGVSVVDYDNDGLQDIYVVNGLWSGSSRDDKIDSEFAVAEYFGLGFSNYFKELNPTKSIFMRILQNDSVSNDGRKQSLSFGGYQRNRLFKNLGDGKFIDVAYLEGIDSEADGYMSAVNDINRDGLPDLVLRNCDPGAKDHMFAPIQVYKNSLAKRNGLWVHLKGTKSNRMAVGAKVFVKSNGIEHARELIANNSAMQGEVVAHVGLGTNEKADEVRVVWPSGISNTYTNVPMGHQTFEEDRKQINTTASSN